MCSQPSKKSKYLICGLSSRAIHSYIYPLLGVPFAGNTSDFSHTGEIVGIVDVDQVRVEAFCAKQKRQFEFYNAADGIEEAILRSGADTLIVTGPDDTHCHYILAGLKHDLRVISEKPVVTNCAEMRAVLAAEKASRGSLSVAHNYRYVPMNQAIKRLVQSGKVGEVTNVEFVYNLDTFHGSSYFERWNRTRLRSGGLTIHKSVHHLDFLNWVLGSVPQQVFAFGSLRYFGANGFYRPTPLNGEEASQSWTREHCPYFLHHREIRERRLRARTDPDGPPYLVQYPNDTYIYDQEIDIEDNYSAVFRYASGASIAFSCNFSTPWEGYQLAINGSKGRIEANYRTLPLEEATGRPSERLESLVFLSLFGGKEEVPVIKATGGHGGGDPLLQHDLFMKPGEESLALGLPTKLYEAAQAIAVGEAIWRSACDGRVYYPEAMLAKDEQSRLLRS